jgi:AcrR family transcriptional regulator
MSQTRKRAYSSRLRQENAEATRARIVAAARELMVGHGYADTTMSEVARLAGVAVQTLYTACPGGKPGLAKMVYDATLAGDTQAIPQRSRADVQAIIDEPDPRAKLALYAATATRIHQRISPVYDVLRAAAAASPTDTGLHGVLAAIEQERLRGSRGPASDLHAAGALRTNLSAAEAATQIYALTSIEVYDRLTTICGWSPARYQRWLAGLLAAALLDKR